MKRIRKTAALLLALLLVFLIGCGSQKGRTIHMDGYTIRTEKTVSETYEPAEETLERSTVNEEMQDFILNKSSKKFHDPSCSGAAEIKAANRWEDHGTRQSVLDMGYVPCKICNP